MCALLKWFTHLFLWRVFYVVLILTYILLEGWDLLLYRGCSNAYLYFNVVVLLTCILSLFFFFLLCIICSNPYFFIIGRLCFTLFLYKGCSNPYFYSNVSVLLTSMWSLFFFLLLSSFIHKLHYACNILISVFIPQYHADYDGILQSVTVLLEL